MQKTVEDIKKAFYDKISILGNILCFIYITINFITFLATFLFEKTITNISPFRSSIAFDIILYVNTLLFFVLLITNIVCKWKKRFTTYIANIVSILIISYELFLLGDPDILLYLLVCIAISFVFLDSIYVLVVGMTTSISIVIVAMARYLVLQDMTIADYVWRNYYSFSISIFLTVFFCVASKYIKNAMLSAQIDEYELDKTKKDNALASRIQEGFLNNEFPSNEVYDIDACMIPSKDVGGDFYDFYLIDKSRIAMIVADVSGKGMPAALLMANAKTVIRNSIINGISFEKSMETANREIMKENKEMQFITIFICIVDLLSGKMNYINAGHVKPFIIDKNGNVSNIVSKPDFIFGVRKETRYHSREYVLNQGDKLFICTDGVTERIDANNKLYGNDRVKETLTKNSKKDSYDVIPLLLKSLNEYGKNKEQNDDITCLLFNYKKKLVIEEPITKDFDILVVKTVDIITYIKDVLKTKEVPERIINFIAVASDEIISNVVKYAYDEMDKEKKLNVDIQVYNRVINISYTDYGKYFNPLSKIELSGTTKVTDKSKIGGLGIQLTWNIMDKVTYDRIDNKNVIFIEKEY